MLNLPGPNAMIEVLAIYPIKPNDNILLYLRPKSSFIISCHLDIKPSR